MPLTLRRLSVSASIALALGATLLLTATPAVALGQGGALKGQISDAAGKALAGASVAIVDLDRTAITNKDGNFALADVPKGRYTVVIRMIGYQSDIQQVTVDANTDIKASLKSNGLRLADVTVTASRSPLSAFATPLPVSSPTSETLQREHGVSLAHTIDGLPGVHSSTTGGQIGKPVIRGFAGSRVLVLQNGLRLEDYSWSDEDGPSVDARLADRVEVIRGPASLLYGSDAMGGVVNVIPAPLPEAAPGSSVKHAAGELYYGSNSHEFGTVLQGEGARGGFGWRTTGIFRAAEALHTPKAELENTGFSAVNGQLSAGWHGDWGSLTARYDRYGGEFKLLEANGPPPGVEEGEEGGPERKLSDDRVQIVGNFPMKNMRIEPKVQWQRHWLSELADAAEVGGTGLTETTIFDLVLNTLSADVLVHMDHGDRMHKTVGVSLLHQSNDSRAPSPGLPFVPDATMNTVAGFALGQAQFGKLSILGGVRGDHRSLSVDANPTLAVTDQDISNDAFSGNIGGALEVAPGASVTLNVGRAWRAPNLFELFANGPLLAEGEYVIGDPTLKPEAGTNVDVGFRWSSSKVRLEVSAYSNSVSDYIFLEPTAETRPAPGSPTGTLQVFRYESGKAKLTGAEFGAALNVTPCTTLRARYDFVRGKNDDTNEDLPLMPPARLDVGADLHSNDFHGWGESFLSIGVENNAKPTHLNPDDYATDGYTLLNFGAGVTPKVAGRPFRLEFEVKNLANTEYKSFLSRYKMFALNPGRDIILRVSTGF